MIKNQVYCFFRHSVIYQVFLLTYYAIKCRQISQQGATYTILRKTLGLLWAFS